jgi:hypothetical protein
VDAEILVAWEDMAVWTGEKRLWAPALASTDKREKGVRKVPRRRAADQLYGLFAGSEN